MAKLRRKAKSPKIATSAPPSRRRLTVEDVYLARDRILPFIRRTPMMAVRESALLHPLKSAPSFFLKLENLQVTGSFKARGALAKLTSMTEEELKRGVITASGGNHGIAVAYAARQVGVPATIYVPEAINPDKRRYMNEWGGKTIVAGPIFHNALTKARKVAEDKNIPFVHTFADRQVICGQGTVGIEILEDLPDLDTLVVAIGGGGLIGGIGIAAHAIKRNLRIIGVEPTGAATLYKSLQAGKVVKLSEVKTKAGTLSMSQTTRINYDLVKDHVEDVVLVSDAEMKKAAEWLWFEMGIAAELSGAAAVAALMFGRVKLKPREKVCALVCGAGLDGISK
jgi:threonine dehydratase